jgi:hypothetical protein
MVPVHLAAGHRRNGHATVVGAGLLGMLVGHTNSVPRIPNRHRSVALGAMSVVPQLAFARAPMLGWQEHSIATHGIPRPEPYGLAANRREWSGIHSGGTSKAHSTVRLTGIEWDKEPELAVMVKE